MSETITTYNMTNYDIPLPHDRAEFYRKQIENFESQKKPNLAVSIINIFIFDSHGEIFIQKRSDNKAHNAGMLDKTIGGHIRYGDSNDYTVMVETIQELQVPSITLQTQDDFQKTYELLKDYLSTIAVIQHIDTKVFELKKNIKGQSIPILNKVHLYFGIYNGAVRTVDREAKGVLLYSLEDLEKDMKSAPNLFTDDLRVLITNYRPQIVDFIKSIKTN